MAEKTRWVTVGALWRNTGKGKQDFSGHISLGILGEVKVMLFPAQGGDRAPQYNIAAVAEDLPFSVKSKDTGFDMDDHTRDALEKVQQDLDATQREVERMTRVNAQLRQEKKEQADEVARLNRVLSAHVEQPPAEPPPTPPADDLPF